MRFTESEIEWAARLRGAGLEWAPQPGHYVFDIDGVMKAGSPFQAGVYMITSINAFATVAGGEDRIPALFAWLPTWEDARSWLEDRGVGRERAVAALASADGGTDRESLYQVMLETLDGTGTS